MSWRSTFVLAFILFAAVALCQDLQKPVTYTARALPLAQVLTDLSKQAGVKLEAGTDMASEPLILRLNSVPIQQAMDRIAGVFEADWVKHNGFWRLERSDAKIAKIRGELLVKRKEAVVRSLDQIRKAVSNNTDLDKAGTDQLIEGLQAGAKKEAAGDRSDDEKILALQSKLPAPNTAKAILLAMSPDVLAAIPVGHRVVFSDIPNAMQHPLPPLPKELYERFDREQALVNSSFDKLVPAQDRGYLTGLLWSASRGKLARIVVADTAFPHDATIHLEFHYFDDRNQEIAMDNEDVGTTTQDWIDGQQTFVNLRQQAQKDGFPLSPIGMEIAPHTMQRESGEMRPLSPEAQDALLHPVDHDPLSIATSDTILTGAEREDHNAVCLATDSCEFYALNAGRLGKTSLAAFEAASKRAGMTFEDADGWLVGKPIDPLDAESARMPRPLMQKFLQDTFQQGYVSIDTAADMLGQAPLDSDTQLVGEEIGYLLPNSNFFVLGSDPDLLRLLGTLSPVQRQAATKAKLVIHVSDLNPDQRAIAYRWFYDAFNPPMQSDTGPAAFANEHLQERTEFFPKSLTDDMELQIEDQVSNVVFLKEKAFNGYVGDIAWPKDYLPERLAQSQHPELFYTVNPSSVLKILGGQQRTVKLQLVQGTKSAEDDAREEHRAAGEMMTVDQYLASLSQADREKLQADIEALLNKQRSQMAGRPPIAPPASGGDGVKPPARAQA